MSTAATRIGSFLASVMGLVLPVALSAASAERAAPNPDVVADFDQLRSYLDSLPDSTLGQGVLTSLEQKVANGQAAYLRGQTCASANILGAYLKQTAGLRQDKVVPVLEDLYNRGRSLRDGVASPTTPPSPCQDRRIGRKPKVKILGSDNKRFAARVTFGAPRLWTVDAGGETWTQLSVPGVQSRIGPPGLPGQPSWQGLVALPRGARAVLVQPGPPAVSETVRLNLHPFQAEPADQGQEEEPFPPPRETFMDRPFVKDTRAYLVDAMVPPTPCALRPLGQYRDLQIAQVQCVAGQYNPVSDEFRLFDSVSFEIRFDGGGGTFITSQTLSPFEPASKGGTQAVLNSAVLSQYVTAIATGDLRCLGEELLILTHPGFHAAAEDLAQWKGEKGILTTVIDVGAGTGYPSAAAIDGLIEGRFDQCSVRPSYVLLLGDSEFVPPSRTTYSVRDDSSTGSDLGYAVYVQFGFDLLIPDFGVGRIPVDTAAEAQRVVDKIINYESHPPFLGRLAGGPFYTTASVASYFQCCRTESSFLQGWDMRSFIETSETVRNQLRANGYGVERIYITNTDYQDNFVPDPTPRRYWDGDQLPSDLRPGSGFAWNGSAQDVIDAFNAGRFNILHRDHGGSSGWVDPPFSTSDFADLTNGPLLPVVYSVNCKSGYFDSETDGGGTTESFMEQMLLHPGGGMVGGLGDVRNSPSWENSALTRGFYDATWPNLAPEFGGPTVRRRLGDILNHGKMYLMSQVGVSQPAGDVTFEDMLDEFILWHVFGDPTLEMWTRNPYQIDLPVEVVVSVLADSVLVQYGVEGTEITALQPMPDGTTRPIGRARVKRGKAKLPFFVTPDPQRPILLSASMENAVSVRLTPR